MKKKIHKLIAIFLSAVVLLTGCGTHKDNPASAKTDEGEFSNQSEEEYVKEIVSDSLSDESLHQYLCDTVYAQLTSSLESDDYSIDNVSCIYVSKAYLDELEYNSKSNIFFGYTLSELDEKFDGCEYYFTLGEDGTTVVKAFTGYDDTYEQVIKNVAIGTGVILVCVTISVASGAVAATAGVTSAAHAVSIIFAASAKTGTTMALSGGLFSAAAKGLITGIETGDVDKAMKAAALSGSEGFKMGAITGAIIGGASKALSIAKSASISHTPRQSEIHAKELYGGEEQVAFLNGEKVAATTANSTRPDLVKNVDGVIEAIEVKNYDLASVNSRQELYRELRRQVSSRVTNLPKGSTQRVVLDVRGRGFSDDLIEMVVRNIKSTCSEFYTDIPVDIMTW